MHASRTGYQSVVIHVGPPGGPTTHSPAGQDLSQELPASPVAKSPKLLAESPEIQQIREKLEVLNADFESLSDDPFFMQHPREGSLAMQRIRDLNKQVNKINTIATRELLRTNLLELAGRLGITLPTLEDEIQEIGKITSSIRALNTMNPQEDYASMGNPHVVMLDGIVSLLDRINEISNTEQQTRLKADLAALATKWNYEISGLNEA